MHRVGVVSLLFKIIQPEQPFHVVGGTTELEFLAELILLEGVLGMKYLIGRAVSIPCGIGIDITEGGNGLNRHPVRHVPLGFQRDAPHG